MALWAFVIYFGMMFACWPSFAVWQHHIDCKRYPRSFQSKGEATALGFIAAAVWPIGWALITFI